MKLEHMIFFSFVDKFFLKYFEISTTSFRDLAKIGRGKTETVTALSVLLPLLGTMFLGRGGLN